MKSFAIFLFALLLNIRMSAQKTDSLFNPNSFLGEMDVTAGIYPHSVVAADFNGDGKPDLFIARGSSDNITVLTNTSSNNTIAFTAAAYFPGTPSDMQGSAVGDLDGDGKPDVVVVNGVGDSSFSVFRNTSLGSVVSFAAKIDFRTNSGPYTIAIGDLDGDGKPDIAIANNGSNYITLYKNNSTPGTISFIKRIDLMVGTNPYGIAIGDLDKDGKSELVVSTQGSNSALWILKNTSVPDSFSFSLPVSYASLAAAFTLAIGDLDGDGNPDIAATGGNPSAILTLRNISSPGNLAFDPPKNFTTGNYMVDVAIRDLDGDSKPELIAVNRFANSVSVLKNRSTVGNVDFENHVDFAVGEAPLIAAIADLDGDGRPDIITANSSSDKISILKNMIGDTVAPIITSFTPAYGITGSPVKILGKNFTGAISVQFGGVNAASFTVDSSTGISAIVGQGASGNLTVMTGFGTATDSGFIFKGPLIYHYAPTNGTAGDTIQISGTNFTGVTTVSFGGVVASSFLIKSDTTIEAILGNGASGNVAVISSEGNYSLAGFGYGGKPSIISFSPVSGPVGSTVIINGNNFNASTDGNIVYFGPVRATVNVASPSQLQVVVPAGAVYDPISVTANYLSAYSSLPFNVNFLDGDSIMSPNSFSLAGNFNTGNYPVAVAVSDLDQDGRPDLITANSIANTLSILQNNGSAGNFSFKANTDLSTGPGPKNIAVADLNGDGKPDIVVSDFNSGDSGYVSIFENTSQNGIISFDTVLNIPTGNGSNGVSIADMNLDGKPDIIVTSGNSGIFSILKNTSAGSGPLSFAPKLDYNTSLFHPDNITVADLDNDGKPDIVISDFSNLSIAIYRNKTTGGLISLDQPVSYPVGQNPGYVRAGDLDGDGKPDLAVANYSSGTITFYKNMCVPGSIIFGNRIDSAIAATSIDFADLNGDGKLDISVGRYQTGNLSVIQNISGGAELSLSPAIDFKTGNFDVFGTIADLDGDGRPDLVAVNVLLNTVTVLKNNIGPPVINFISDTIGFKGKSITMTGRKLTGVTMVRFGDIPALSFQVVSSTQIDAVVNDGASGNITVGSPSGIGMIPGFRFVPGIVYQGTTSFCKNTPFILNSTASSGNQWYQDSAMINGETGNTLEVVASGLYSVRTTSNGITTSSDSGISVNILTAPVPSISKNEDNVLVSSMTTGNQWYLNGAIIPGATNETCTPWKNGSYTVTHFENGCTSDYSTAFNVNLTENIDLGNGQYARLYPNPVTTDLTIKWDMNDVSSLSISITDLQGNTILVKSDFQQAGTSIDLSGLSPGYYLVKMYNPKSDINKTIKIIKSN
jgi:hypothetical protein